MLGRESEAEYGYIHTFLGTQLSSGFLLEGNHCFVLKEAPERNCPMYSRENQWSRTHKQTVK